MNERRQDDRTPERMEEINHHTDDRDEERPAREDEPRRDEFDPTSRGAETGELQ